MRRLACGPRPLYAGHEMQVNVCNYLIRVIFYFAPCALVAIQRTPSPSTTLNCGRRSGTAPTTACRLMLHGP
jgi:hypothetical protein